VQLFKVRFTVVSVISLARVGHSLFFERDATLTASIQRLRLQKLATTDTLSCSCVLELELDPTTLIEDIHLYTLQM